MFPLHDSIPRIRTPVIVYAIIVLNALVFLYQVSLPHDGALEFAYRYGMVPMRYFDLDWGKNIGLSPNNYWPFLTATFMHGGWLHIIINMWTLFIFGASLEGRMGPVPFLAFYISCAVASTYVHGYFNQSSEAPVIGASGAIAGVIGAYAFTYPHARVTLLVPVIFIPLVFSIPAVAFAAVWFGIQVLQGAWDLASPSVGDGIAWWAHIGGFVSGLVLLPVFLLFAPAPPEPQQRPREWEPGPWDGPNWHDR
jgi:membrane associated rhomboid family serine protease